MGGDARRVPVTVLGGYLGAGKTTALIAALTAAHGQRIAVIVNDFGDLHIDAALIADRAATRIDLANGCACCQVGDNLAEAFFQLAEHDPPWDRIVVEASGVADPARVAGWASLPGLRLDGIVVAADATSIATQVHDRYVGDLVRHQVEVADLVLLAKCDLADRATVDAAEATITALAPGAPLVHSAGDPPIDAVFGLDHHRSHGRGEGDGHGTHDHGDRFVTITWNPSGPVDTMELRRVLATTSGLVRAKGFVPTADGTVLVQAVAARVHLGPVVDAPGTGTGLVLIGVRGVFDPDACRDLLDTTGT